MPIMTMRTNAIGPEQPSLLAGFAYDLSAKLAEEWSKLEYCRKPTDKEMKRYEKRKAAEEARKQNQQ